MKSLYKIGELSKLSGSSIDTIRFYEDKGLLVPKSRSQSGTRSYDTSALKALSFINSAKELGFSLSEINEFLLIRTGKKNECSLSLKKISHKEEEVDGKIKELKKIKKALHQIATICKDSGGKQPCHFLEMLEEKGRSDEKR